MDLGKTVIKMDGFEYDAVHHSLTVDEQLWNQILFIASEEQLNGIMSEMVRLENYEEANDAKKTLEQRFGKTKI